MISNPCFEIWLYFHKRKEISDFDKVTCKTLKLEVSTFEKGGYAPQKFIPYLLDAILNSENIDTSPAHFLPEKGVSKVYQLGKALIQIIGKKRF